jgi:hypothetical protein
MFGFGNLTLEQAAMVMARYVALVGMDVTTVAYSTPIPDNTSSCAVDSMTWAMEAGLLNSLGEHITPDARSAVTNSEVMAILFSIWQTNGILLLETDMIHLRHEHENLRENLTNHRGSWEYQQNTPINLGAQPPGMEYV